MSDIPRLGGRGQRANFYQTNVIGHFKNQISNGKFLGKEACKVMYASWEKFYTKSITINV